MDLRAGLLRARRHREPHQGIAPGLGDRPHELLEILGQPVPRADDGGGLRTDARVAAAGAGLDFARAVAEVGSLHRRLRPPDGDSSFRLVSVSRQLPSDRSQFRRFERIGRQPFPPTSLSLASSPSYEPIRKVSVNNYRLEGGSFGGLSITNRLSS